MTSITQLLTKTIEHKREEIDAWFSKTFAHTPPFFYSSVDIRHSGHKMAPVDTNLFPGGFNNLNDTERKTASHAVSHYIKSHHPNLKSILVIAENHTRNAYYFENIVVLRDIITNAGLQVHLSSFDMVDAAESLNYQSASGTELTLEPFVNDGSKLVLHNGIVPDLIIINNDMTEGHPNILDNISQPITPPTGFGWYQRRKTSHFDSYNELAKDLCRHIDIDPWLISTHFSRCGKLNFKEQTGIECIARNVDKVIHLIGKKYDEYGIQEDPYVFIKSDQGTYGMGIMTAKSGSDVLSLNKNTRKKMNAIKGGTTNTEVIIQEGIPTIDTVEGNPAEPMLYVIGHEPVGCMYRVNTKQDHFGNLNSTGMTFTSVAYHHSNNQFCQSLGLVAKLASYAAAWECYAADYSI